ncbi:SpoIIE family protein phosphatase [Lonsdalea britannica]|uniref:SpoIIE family protein phosphatase n=1 Tax=Lonsdalea britannica TaxID=1082704 RepID=UPI0026EF3A1E|nr:SpoIIE family protein phosphatase [Lonsdalea britannica]
MGSFAISTRHFFSLDVPSAQHLCTETPEVSPSTDNATVLQLFSENEALVSLPVVKDGRPCGLINRHLFLSQMSRQYYRELYDRKSCTTFMDGAPLIIEADTALQQVAEQAVDAGGKCLTDGFLIVDNGRYLGMGLGIDLIKTVADMHARRHRQIVQSIEYASVIQTAMLTTSRQAMSATLADWCLVWEPRDCVGGDCYYFKTSPGGWLAVIADCTGHGVPGAFMTLIFSAALEQALSQHGPEHPALLLCAINRYIKNTLGQAAAFGQTSASNDGCDAIALFVDTSSERLYWSSARMSAFIIGEAQNACVELESDRMGIGYTDTPYDYQWPTFQRHLAAKDAFFTTTDGLTEQVGGERNIMFGKRRLQRLLEKASSLSMPALAEQLAQQHKIWQGAQRRRDDVTFWGFRHQPERTVPPVLRHPAMK